MRQIWLIASHGFYQHATSRPFLIGLLLLPLYMIIGGALPTLSQSQLAALGGPVRHFAVIDHTGVLLPAIDAGLEREVLENGVIALAKYVEENGDTKRLKEGEPELADLLLDSRSPRTIAAIEDLGGVNEAFVTLRPYLKPGAPPFTAPPNQFFRIDLPHELEDAPDIAEAARPYLTAEKLVAGPQGVVSLWAILVVPEGFIERGEPAQYYSDDILRLGLREVLRSALDRELKRRALASSVAEPEVPKILDAAGEIHAIDPAPERLGAISYVRQFSVIGAVIVYLMLFTAVFMTANMVVMALVEEKSNRVAELLLSCVRAETLMAGKLFTGLMLAIFLVGVWIVSAIASVDLLFPTAQAIVKNLIDSISTVPQLLLLLAFFSLSYLTIAAFFLAAGSAATSITDAQAIVAPATMVTLPVFMLPIAVAYAPDSIFARFISFVPFFSPFTMMVRSFSAPDGLDVLGALVVSVLTLWWMIRLVARVFRANLLRPDSSSSFLAFLRDLFTARRTA